MSSKEFQTFPVEEGLPGTSTAYLRGPYLFKYFPLKFYFYVCSFELAIRITLSFCDLST